MEKINLAWWTGKNGKNFGDALNPIIAKLISNKEINHVGLKDSTKTFRYYMIGSILQFIYSDNCIIWGSGFMGETSEMNIIPKKICAVRGKLTREKLLKKGYNCPDVYGDPALLYPSFYNPKVEKKYKIGIMPHYVDSDNLWIQKFKNNKDILIINALDGVNKIVTDILSCDCIISSSLHGLIVADAYNIPSLWVEFSNKIGGNGFKFRDYFSSVNRIDSSPIKINNNIKIKDILNQFYDYKIDIDLNKLYNSCPFK